MMMTLDYKDWRDFTISEIEANNLILRAAARTLQHQIRPIPSELFPETFNTQWLRQNPKTRLFGAMSCLSLTVLVPGRYFPTVFSDVVYPITWEFIIACLEKEREAFPTNTSFSEEQKKVNPFDIPLQIAKLPETKTLFEMELLAINP